MVRGLLVMEAKQVAAVIIAVGCPHDGVDVEFLRRRIIQDDAFVLVELDHHHRTLNAIIKRAVFTHAAGPAEMGLQNVAFDIVQPRRERARRQRR